MSRAAETSVQGFKFIFSEGSDFYLLNAAGAPYVTPSSHEMGDAGWSFQHYFSLVPSVQNHHWLHALPWFQSADWCSFSATDRAGHMFHFNDPPMKIRHLTLLTFIWRFYTIQGMWWLNNQSGWQHCQGLRASVSSFVMNILSNIFWSARWIFLTVKMSMLVNNLTNDEAAGGRLKKTKAQYLMGSVQRHVGSLSGK